jgi:hypothetical protein
MSETRSRNQEREEENCGYDDELAGHRSSEGGWYPQDGLAPPDLPNTQRVSDTFEVSDTCLLRFLRPRADYGL